ncbi:MAG: hypothetical protein ACFCVA_04005 [Gammaproteobacteria bacterium]
MYASRSLITLGFCCCLGVPQIAAALTANLQGQTRTLTLPGSTCLDLTGNYEGFRIEAPERSKMPYVCFSSQRRNVLRFFDVAIVATNAGVGMQTLEFEHEFFTGPQGIVYAEVKLDGFVASASGAGVPTGSRVSLTGYLRQRGTADQIGEGLRQEVAETVDSALLDRTSREQYLTGGSRRLKAVLRFSFESVGDKLVLGPETAVLVTGIKELIERLGELSTTGTFVPPQPGGGAGFGQ